MSKKVLAIYYSQSGQLGEIIDCFTEPLVQTGISVEKIRIRPATDYAFPWTGERFFKVMPDCVLSVPAELQPFTLKESSYDLIILGYQAWFLSPSIPSNSLLQHSGFRTVLKDTPVITITGARNMWLNAFERIKKSLRETGARLVGRKDSYLNIFPAPGVAAADISGTKTFGALVLPHLVRNDWTGLQAELVSQRAVELKYKLMFIEARARGIFLAWARFISKRRKKSGWLVAFKYYLLIALFIAAPIILTVDAILFKPFLAGRIKRQKQYYSGVN
jgi:hypothetical protein